MKELLGLIKFGRKEHLERLMNDGEIRFSPVSAFQECTEEERGDNLEGAITIINEQFVKVECDHPALGKHTFTPASDTLGRIVLYSGNKHCCFSSYALCSDLFAETDKHKIDERMLKFGDYALIITEPHQFLKRVTEALRRQSVNFDIRLVEYKNLIAEGTIHTTLFTKKQELKHQSECRILIETVAEGPKYLTIGNISEICVISKADSLIATEFTAVRRAKDKP